MQSYILHNLENSICIMLPLHQAEEVGNFGGKFSGHCSELLKAMAEKAEDTMLL